MLALPVSGFPAVALSKTLELAQMEIPGPWVKEFGKANETPQSNVYGPKPRRHAVFDDHGFWITCSETPLLSSAKSTRSGRAGCVIRSRFEVL